mmetsp:Transcript_19349/g.40034  ORF Transcript_19349/g.40034 Transcript_19349/m.40034 type:complete len:288 (+) Transcript_19349:1998-2861(+)
MLRRELLSLRRPLALHHLLPLLLLLLGRLLLGGLGHVPALPLPLELCANVHYEVALRSPEEDAQVGMQAVVVLGYELLARVEDVACEVLDDEVLVAEPRLGVVRVRVRVLLVERRHELAGRHCPAEHAGLLEEGEDAVGLSRDEIDYVLVVLEGDDVGGDTLLLIQLLLPHENLLVELLLKLLVGEVDAQLRQRVVVHDFEPEYVKDADERRRVHRQGVRLVDLLNEEVKQGAVAVLDERLDALPRLARVEVHRHERAAAGPDLPHAHGAPDGREVAAEERREQLLS